MAPIWRLYQNMGPDKLQRLRESPELLSAFIDNRLTRYQENSPDGFLAWVLDLGVVKPVGEQWRAISPYPFQLEYGTLLADPDIRKLLIAKARRMGFTTITELWLYWWLFICEDGIGSTALCMSKDSGAAKNLLRALRHINAHQPAWVRVPIGQATEATKEGDVRGIDTTEAFSLPDRGHATVHSLTSGSSQGRGEGAEVVLWDEAAHLPKAADPEEVLSSLGPTTETQSEEAKSKLVIGSTGNGSGPASQGRVFAGLVKGATPVAKNGYTFRFWPWHAHPARQLEDGSPNPAWWEQELATQGYNVPKTRREYPSTVTEALMSDSSGAAFNMEDLERAIDKGREYAAMQTAGTLPPPKPRTRQIGCDWGGHSGAVLLHELAGKNFYIAAEKTTDADDMMSFSNTMLEWDGRGFPIDEFRYDAAGSTHTRTFILASGDRIPTYGVPFGTNPDFKSNRGFKHDIVDFIRGLMTRTAKGANTWTLAIDPSCQSLIDDMSEARKDADGHIVKKTGKEGHTGQHTLDGLIAVLGPETIEWHATMATTPG